MEKHTLLVVDDDKTNLTAVRSILGEEYQLDLANSGMLALRFMEKKEYDLVLLDIMMPEMDGIETYQRLRELDHGKDVPVIFLTGDQAAETEVQCLQIGASDFITKPIVAEVMKSRIARTIELQEFRTDLEGRLKTATESLRASIEERQKIATELGVAAQIQLDALPSTFPPFPDRPEFDIYACMRPAKEVGGDFYDFFLLDEDHLCLVIADVSGKGMPGSLFMMTSKTRINDHALYSRSPAAILTEVNNLLCENNTAQMFVTVWLGILEISTGNLTAVNAGHEYPILRKPGGEYRIVPDKHYLAVAAMEGVRYKEETYRLEPGSTLFLYTDGVAESTNAEKELFGTERMLQALNRNPNGEVREATEAMQQAIDAFVQDAPQFDDITMLCIRYNGKK